MCGSIYRYIAKATRSWRKSARGVWVLVSSTAADIYRKSGFRATCARDISPHGVSRLPQRIERERVHTSRGLRASQCNYPLYARGKMGRGAQYILRSARGGGGGNGRLKVRSHHAHCTQPVRVVPRLYIYTIYFPAAAASSIRSTPSELWLWRYYQTPFILPPPLYYIKPPFLKWGAGGVG